MEVEGRFASVHPEEGNLTRREMGESIKTLTGVGCRESACLSFDSEDGSSKLLRNVGKRHHKLENIILVVTAVRTPSKSNISSHVTSCLHSILEIEGSNLV